MKAGPIVAMVALVAVGMWLVLQPALSRDKADLTIRIGAEELRAVQASEATIVIPEDGGLVEGPLRATYEFLEPPELAELGPVTSAELDQIIDERVMAWQERNAFERTLLGFFNITGWTNFVWVAVGLAGQGAFFGRMFVQWIVSEKSGKSQVPELFWWFSFLGGVCLFTYFVWRVDVVGVLGQSTGIVIYARNLRLIHKQKRREQRAGAIGGEPQPGAAPSVPEAGSDGEGAASAPARPGP